MTDESWPPEWTRAVLAQSALAIIAAEGTTYGYRIIQRLEASGLGTVKGGTLYPILARFEREGWTTSAWGEGAGGPGRKFVSITDIGRAEVDRWRDQWEVFACTIGSLWAAKDSEA